jgi:hypothetical protein
MKKWFTRIGRAAMMGLAWAAAWVPAGSLAGWLIIGEMEPEWIGGPLYAGFLCGATFSLLAGVTQAKGAVDEMSLPRSGMVGAMSGLVVGGLWLVVVLLSDPPLWLFEGAVVGGLTALSAISGVGSAVVARIAKNGGSARVV